MELQAALLSAFPACTDLNEDRARGITGFVPHFSLGQWRSSADAEAAAKVRISTLSTHIRSSSRSRGGSCSDGFRCLGIALLQE